MQLSKHAAVRSQQRGIPKDYIQMIMEYGTPTRKPGNAFEYKIHRKNRDRVIGHLKRLMTLGTQQEINKLLLPKARDINEPVF